MKKITALIAAIILTLTTQAQVPISALPSATGDLRNGVLPIVINGATRKATPLQLSIFDSIHVTQGTTYDSMWVMKGGVRLYYKLIRSGTAGGADSAVFATKSWAGLNFQPLNLKLTTFSSLSNGTGWLYNNGSGTYSWSIPNLQDVTTQNPNTNAGLYVVGGGSTLRFGITPTVFTNFFHQAFPASVQIDHGTGNWGFVLSRSTTGTGAAHFTFYRTRSGNANIRVPLNNGEPIGAINYHTPARDTTFANMRAAIFDVWAYPNGGVSFLRRGFIPPTGSASGVPGRFLWGTTGMDGVFRYNMSLLPDGELIIGSNNSRNNYYKLQVDSGASVQHALLVHQNNEEDTVHSSAIVEIKSNNKGALLPRLTGAQMNSIPLPGTGLLIYNTDSSAFCFYDGTQWTKIGASAGGGSGTINSGTQYRLPYYANTGTTLSPLPAITGNRALASDANGLPVHSNATAGDLNNIAGLSSNVQTQINTINAQLAAMKDVRIDSTYQPIAGINGSGELQFRSDSIGSADNKVSVTFNGNNLTRRWNIQLNEANIVLANLNGALPTAKGGVPTGGTTGQVLQKNSNSNYDVSWVTPSGGSSNTPVTLLTRTVSAKDTFNIDLSAWYLTYDLIRIEIYNTAPVTDGAIAQIRVSSDGTNYDAGASNYVWMNKLLSSTGFTGDAASNGTALVLSHTDGVDNAANVDFTSTLEIRNPDASTKHFISINSRYANNGGTHYSYVGAGARDAQQILRGIQFRFSTGNISKATIKVIGIQ
jgi:hypothetical protein